MIGKKLMINLEPGDVFCFLSNMKAYRMVIKINEYKQLVSYRFIDGGTTRYRIASYEEWLKKGIIEKIN